MYLLPPIYIERVKTTLRALRHRNYRLFFMGQGLSLVGTWLQNLVLPWITYRLTGSAFMLGLVGFLGQIPVLLLGPIAGVVSDRVDRRRLLLTTQSLAMILAGVLAWLTLTDQIHVWHIILLGSCLGLVNAFDIPMRQAFIFELVDDKNDIGNAVALNSMQVNLARLVGPAIGAALVAISSEGYCFLFNAISYIAVLISLAMIRLHAPAHDRPHKKVLADLREGFDYVFGFVPIRDMLILLAITSLIGMSFTILLPVFAKDILHGEAGTLGLLLASSGLGAVIGAIYLASRRTVLGLGRLIPIGCATLGASAIIFAMSDSLLLSCLSRLTGSVGMVIEIASCNTIMQTLVDDDRRGRVMAFFSMCFVGMSPIGALLGGSLAHAIGPARTLLITGSILLLVASVFARKLDHLRSLIRPIYQQRGILPAAAPDTLHRAP